MTQTIPQSDPTGAILEYGSFLVNRASGVYRFRRMSDRDAESRFGRGIVSRHGDRMIFVTMDGSSIATGYLRDELRRELASGIASIECMACVPFTADELARNGRTR